MRSNVVSLTHPVELRRWTIDLTQATLRAQRAVVAWAGLVGEDFHGSVLRLIEREALVTDRSLIYERQEPPLLRYAARGTGPHHRLIAEQLLGVPFQAKPKAYGHELTVIGGGSREVQSLVLPTGRHIVVQFDG